VCVRLPLPVSLPEKQRKKRSKWHLGIRSRSLPHEIMAEVFAAMKALGMVRTLSLSLSFSFSFSLALFADGCLVV
jgi:hypothetical protein